MFPLPLNTFYLELPGQTVTHREGLRGTLGKEFL